jgi:hypothetical protein
MRLTMISRDLLKKLTSEQEGPLVSLYMQLGGEGGGGEVRRLNILLDDAEKKLADVGLSPKGCAQFLASARAYAEELPSHSGNGQTLALFLSPASFYTFTLPVGVPDCMQIGPHFCIAPLLPYLHKNGDCHILAVSKKHARLLHVTGQGIHEVEVEGMPHSFNEAFQGLEHQDKELQFHGGGPGSAGGSVFHGQGGANDLAKDELEEYLHKIAKAVDHTLQGQHALLVFAGIDEEFGMLRKYLSYPHLADQPLKGNPDVMSGEEMAEKAMEMMQPLWNKEREVALEVYGPLAGTGRTSSDIQAILDLSHHGKVEGLLVREGAMLWGEVKPESGIAEVHPAQEAGDSELVSLAAVHTLQHKGWVYALPAREMPEQAEMVAILRY